ncbi:hypothetical protein Pan161_14700 [Gimesia algae]|uniref:Uncharacterized protein n=1 Tax=Gimesia algae TaxID=2527971 RepID=A0A517VA05_9PLAN|nr:hypothetical protein Pan161_14700 [Gimesia algae]
MAKSVNGSSLAASYPVQVSFNAFLPLKNPDSLVAWFIPALETLV